MALATREIDRGSTTTEDSNTNDDRSASSDSESQEEKSQSLHSTAIAKEVEADATFDKANEVQILKRCRKAVALGVGILEGTHTMYHAIHDLLNQP